MQCFFFADGILFDLFGVFGSDIYSTHFAFIVAVRYAQIRHSP